MPFVYFGCPCLAAQGAGIGRRDWPWGRRCGPRGLAGQRPVQALLQRCAARCLAAAHPCSCSSLALHAAVWPQVYYCYVCTQSHVPSHRQPTIPRGSPGLSSSSHLPPHLVAQGSPARLLSTNFGSPFGHRSPRNADHSQQDSQALEESLADKSGSACDQVDTMGYETQTEATRALVKKGSMGLPDKHKMHPASHRTILTNGCVYVFTLPTLGGPMS